MNKACPEIQVIIVICMLLASNIMKLELAYCADESSDDTVTISTAQKTIIKASDKRDNAAKMTSLVLAEEALADAETAAFQLTRLSQENELMAESEKKRMTGGFAGQKSNEDADEDSRSVNEIEKARMITDLAGQNSEVVADIVTMPRQAIATALSFSGRGTGNIGLAQKSLEVAERLCRLVWNFDRLAIERNDAELKQSVRKAAQSIRFTIKQVANTADYIASTSAITEEVKLAEELKDQSQHIQYCTIDQEEQIVPCEDPDCDPPASAV